VASRQLGDPDVIPMLRRLTADSEQSVRQSAQEALEVLGPKHHVRTNSVLAKGGDVKAIEALIAELQNRDALEVSDILVEVGFVAVEPLIKALNDEDGTIRWPVADILGRISDARALEPLMAVLNDDDRRVRWAAAYALGQICNARALKPLTLMLKDVDLSVRWASAYAIGKISASQKVDPLDLAECTELLIKLLKYADLRWVATYSLGMLGDIKATDALIRLWDGKEYEVTEKDPGIVSVMSPCGTTSLNIGEEVYLALNRISKKNQINIFPDGHYETAREGAAGKFVIESFTALLV